MAGEFGPDGTQDPPPLPTFPDPLSGLVTGESLPWPVRAQPQPVAAPPSAPQPDSHAVQEALRAAVAQDQRRRARMRPPTQPAVPAPPPPVLPAQPAKQSNAAATCFGCLIALLVVGAIFAAVVASFLH